MNIQPTGSAGAAKTDDRAVAGASSAPVAAKPAATTGVTGATAKPASAASGVEPTRNELDSAVKKLNETLPASSQDLQFSVDEDSKRTVVKLIDRNTHEVLRQMPTKEALEIAKSLDKAMGKLIDQTA